MIRPVSAERLRVTEIYLSIQGESRFAGLPCVFVRTTGCPLRCRWCDTAYAFYGGEEMSLDAVAAQVLSHDVPLVEVTGGEPLAQRNVLSLMRRLCDAGKTVLLETSGALDIAPVDPRVTVIMDLKCPDSGETEKNRWENVPLLKPSDEVKFVIASRADYDYAKWAIAEHGLTDRCQVLLSTVFGEAEPRAVVQWMLDDKVSARFQLQLHKLIWPPTQRGV